MYNVISHSTSRILRKLEYKLKDEDNVSDKFYNFFGSHLKVNDLFRWKEQFIINAWIRVFKNYKIFSYNQTIQLSAYKSSAS